MTEQEQLAFKTRQLVRTAKQIMILKIACRSALIDLIIAKSTMDQTSIENAIQTLEKAIKEVEAM
jgi:hypothetical protein